MYAVTGVATKTVYFRGSKADRFRYLNTHYPSFEETYSRKGGAFDKLINPVFPESMAVSRIVNH